jgi:hypothetical protein
MLKRPRGGRWRSATSTAITYRPRCEGNSPCLFDDGSMQVTLEYKGVPRFTESTPVPKSQRGRPVLRTLSHACTHMRDPESIRLRVYCSASSLSPARLLHACRRHVGLSPCPASARNFQHSSSVCSASVIVSSVMPRIMRGCTVLPNDCQ